MYRLISAFLISLLLWGVMIALIGESVTAKQPATVLLSTKQEEVQITISPWTPAGDKKWVARFNNEGESGDISVSEGKDGYVIFVVEWTCTSADRFVPKRILAWSGGYKQGLGFDCRGNSASSSTLPSLFEEAAVREKSFPQELRGKFKVPAPREFPKKFEHPPLPPKEEAIIDWNLRRGNYRI